MKQRALKCVVVHIRTVLVAHPHGAITNVDHRLAIKADMAIGPDRQFRSVTDAGGIKSRRGLATPRVEKDRVSIPERQLILSGGTGPVEVVERDVETLQPAAKIGGSLRIPTPGGESCRGCRCRSRYRAFSTF